MILDMAVIYSNHAIKLLKTPFGKIRIPMYSF